MTINSVRQLIQILLFIFYVSVRSLEVNKIIDGKKAVENEFPFAVSIQSSNMRQRCGGSILSKWYVLTACHCVVYFNMSHGRIGHFDIRNLLMVAGSSFRIPHKRTQVRRVDYAFVHPECHATRDRYLVFDVALLKPVMPFVLHRFVKPLPILSFDKTVYLKQRDYLMEYEVQCQAVGWGTTVVSIPLEKYAEPSDDLMVLDVKLLDNPTCFQILCEFHTGFCSMDPYLYEMLCAMGPDGKDVCNGDSGGSILCNGFGFGIVSWGPACGEVLAPTVYQPLYEVLDFFERVMPNSKPKTKHYNLEITTE